MSYIGNYGGTTYLGSYMGGPASGGGGGPFMPSPSDVRFGVPVDFTVGNLVLPDVADVRVGVQYGSLGVEFTGTYAGGGGGGGGLTSAQDKKLTFIFKAVGGR